VTSARLTTSAQDARLFASSSSQDARPALGGDPRSTSSRRVAQGVDPRATSSRSVARPAPEAAADAERTVTLSAGAAASTGGGGLSASEATIKLAPGVASGLAAGAFGPPAGPGAGPAAAGFSRPPGGSDDTVPMGSKAPLPLPDPASGAVQRGTGRPSPTAFAGRRIDGKYEIVRELGRGNMGIVFLAATLATGRQVALKVVQGPANADARGRFRREILVSKRVQHAHVIEVIDAGELENKSSYMVMELLDTGGSLTDLIKAAGALPVPRALDLFEQLLRGLEAVHGAKVVHRDLKPDNVHVLARDGGEHVKVVDFGISRFLDQEVAEEQQVFVTVRGTLSGTPQYVAPEAVLDPELVTTTHDVYAAGVILFEMLTGTLPFPPGRTLKDILADTVNTRPRALDEAYPPGAPFPPPLERFLRRLLEKDPAVRPGDATQALAALAALRDELAGKAAPARKGVAKAAAREEGITARFLRKITSIFKRTE
jgi:hypothetical protein